MGRRVLVDVGGGVATYGEEESIVTIVGMVGEVSLRLTDRATPHLYLSYAQRPTLLGSLVVRTSLDPMSIAPAVRDAIWEVDPDQPVWEIMPISERIAGSIRSQRFLMVLMALFAVVALILGSVGIYGVMGYTVGQRSREIGIRLALGARGSQIRTMVLRQGLATALVATMAQRECANYPLICLHVAADNTSARRAYERMGMAVMGDCRIMLMA